MQVSPEKDQRQKKAGILPPTSIGRAGWQCAVRVKASQIFSVHGDQGNVISAEINTYFSGLCVGANLFDCKRIESMKVGEYESVIYSRINQKKYQRRVAFTELCIGLVAHYR